MIYRDTIPFKEMIAVMDSGAEFSLEVVTYDRKKRKGGEWLSISNAVKHSASLSLTMAKKYPYHPVSTQISRSPNHYANSTRNIRLRNRMIRKVHLRLIRVFNNKIVI